MKRVARSDSSDAESGDVGGWMWVSSAGAVKNASGRARAESRAAKSAGVASETNQGIDLGWRIIWVARFEARR